MLNLVEPEARNQSCKHINSSTVFGDKRLQKSEISLFVWLNADSDATDEAGATKASLAIRDRVGYSSALLLHQPRISKNPSLRGMAGFDK